MTASTFTEDLLPFSDPGYLADPYPFYERARAEGPVYESPFGVHVITRHADVFRLLRDNRLSALKLDAGVANLFHDCIIGQDSPDHGRLRRVSAPWFTPAKIAEWSAYMQQQVDAALDAAEGREVLDLVDDLCIPATFNTMAHILGVGTEGAETAIQATLDIGKALRPAATEQDIARGQDCFSWCLAYIEGHIAAKEKDPGEGMLDWFLQAEREGAMNRREVIATTMLFYAVGYLDNSYLILNTIRLLQEMPGIKSLWLTDPSARQAITSEVLRIDAPEHFGTRVALQDIEVGDAVIPAGAVVILMNASGNHDPSEFAEPSVFDHTRGNLGRILSFAGGQHGCVGQYLARAQNDVTVTSFLTRFPDAVQEGPIEWSHTEFIRGMAHYPMRLNP